MVNYEQDVKIVNKTQMNYSNSNECDSCYALIRFRSSRPRRSVKKMFLKISQNSQENTCARVTCFNKVKAL